MPQGSCIPFATRKLCAGEGQTRCARQGVAGARYLRGGVQRGLRGGTGVGRLLAKAGTSCAWGIRAYHEEAAHRAER
jgi:hypothetical protein